MKYSIICILFFIAACNVYRPKNDLSRVYVASYEHEFSKTDDTLTVTKTHNTDKMYQIKRPSWLIKKMDGKEFPTQSLLLGRTAYTKIKVQ